jgi:hypothetical protein
VTSGDFDWVAWEDLIEDAAQLEASSPASRATIERIFVKRRAKAKSVKELVIADLWKRVGWGRWSVWKKIWATFLEDGSLTLSGVDYGEAVRAFKGDDDYEYDLLVPPESVQDLTLFLLETTFNTHSPMTFSRLERLCKRHGIKATKSDWH